MTPRMPIGILIKKISRQRLASTSKPPRIGPRAGCEHQGDPEDAEGSPLLFGREGPVELGGTERLGNAAAKSLQGAGRDQPAQRGSQPAQERADHEDRQPQQVHALDAEPVRQEAGNRRGDTQRQDIDADHPLGLGQRGAEFTPQGGKGNVDDRGVQDDHEDPEHDRDQHLPLAFQAARLAYR